MTTTFDLVEEENIGLVVRELGQRALERQAESRMCPTRAGLKPWRLLGIFVCDFFFAQPAAPRVVAGVNQDPVGPGDKTRLSAKAGYAAMHFQKRLLYRVFRVNEIAKKISRQIFHSRAMLRVETFVGAQVAGPAGGG